MYVTHRYVINDELRAELEAKTPDFGFNGFGEATYYRTYSRQKEDGSQEQWADTVIRVVEGVLSIRKDWYIKHGLPVDSDKLDEYANRLSHAIYDMKMLPPGRGLWAMGTNYVFERGSLALNNCGFCDVKLLSRDMNWAMDALMCGVGVGVGIFGENAQKLKQPFTTHTFTETYGVSGPIASWPTIHHIPDSREGWVKSLELLLRSYENGSGEIQFDYSKIRPYGAPIAGFGGKASGADPLIKLHDRVRLACDRYVDGKLSWTRLCADIANSIGACVVAGNVRRCLPEGTVVSTGDDGSNKLIEDIRVGDYVRTKLGSRKVTNVFDQGVQQIVEIRTVGERILRCTENHRIAVISGDRWEFKKAKDLTIGDRLVLDNKAYIHQKFIGDTRRRYLMDPTMGQPEYVGDSFSDIVYTDGKCQTYDIEVEEAHHFTANGFVVHNSAEILLGSIEDKEFVNLKTDVMASIVYHNNAVWKCTEYHDANSENEPSIDSQYWQHCYDVSDDKVDLLPFDMPNWISNEKYDGRSSISWMSNNTVRLERKPEFRQIPSIAKLITSNGEPGVMNFTNVKEHARFGDLKEDTATGCNPCLPAWTHVLTPAGARELGDIFIGSIIWSETGWTRVTNKWSSGIKDVYEYNTRSGTFYGTVNHRVVCNGVKKEVQEASHIDSLLGESCSLNSSECLELNDVSMTYHIGTGLIVEDWDQGKIQSLQDYLSSCGIPSVYDVEHDNDGDNHALWIECKYYDAIDSARLIKISKVHSDACFPKLDPNEILSSEKISTEEVFDITVDNTTHTFWNNGLNVSNCGEIPLESYELCNLSEVFPTRCKTKGEFYEALELAAFYSSTVSLLPTHREETNEVVNRNRRIGVSISGIADWIDKYGITDCIPMMRKGYKIVRKINAELAKEAGIPESIRVSAIKPSGSISQLAGVSSGMHFPTFRYAIRRMRVSEGSELVPVLQAAGVPWEKDTYSDNTLVFEFPIDQGKTRPANEVSAWEQFALLSTLQREWADNMVSCTVYFNPETEGDQIEHMLGQFAPTIKSVSMLPHTEDGAYAQMPYEGISKEEYERRQCEIAPIYWDAFGGSDGEDSRFCSNGTCSVNLGGE